MVFPRNIKCISCGCEIRKTDKYSLCKDCYEDIDFISRDEKKCEICSRPISEDSPYDRCRDCLGGEYFFDKVFSSMVYSGVARKLITGFKYREKRYIGYYLSQIILDSELANYLYTFDYIIPVPSSKKKRRARGFNQTEIIAKYLSNVIDIEFRKDILNREDTKFDQNQLGREERKSNIGGRIHFDNSDEEILYGKKVILIDDVYTTGSTANECARILKENHAKTIVVVVSAIASLEQ